ncbi:helicase, partial [Vibrio parahaemolyticus]
MHTGTEINEQIPDIEANRATKSNIFGKGYEKGELVSIGCSYKGKIWAMDSDSLDKWIAWCKGVGSKILDDSIDTNEVMKTAMQTEELEAYPNIPPLSIEWPVPLLRKNETKVTVASANWECNLINCELLVAEVQDGNANSLNITLRTEHSDSQITATIATKGEAIFNSLDNLDIKFGEKTLQLSEYFNENPPTIFMADTSVIDGGFR